jgi:carboxypeptidase Taq
MKPDMPLYEQNIDPSLTRTALTTEFLGQYAVGGTSYGAHEASSRLWDNQIGRSRAFWQAHFDHLREYFPEQLADVDVDLFCRAVHRVQPSLIRVEAEEVTYNLHIMLRVEVEMGLLMAVCGSGPPGSVAGKNAGIPGVLPTTDSEGPLQDVTGRARLGSFPLSIGNVMSAQLLQAVQTS